MTDISFGRYTPYKTPIHGIDARNKILLLILLMVTIFLQFSLWSTNLLLSGFYLLLLVGLMLVSKVSLLSLFKSLSTMWFLILFLLIIYIFIPNNSYIGTAVAFEINGFKVYWAAFYQCAYIILRLLMVLSITMVLTSTTKPMDLTYGLEWYMNPLKVIKFPSHEIAMTLSIALRFIPTLIDESDRIMKAQASRGIDFNHGAVFKRFKAVISLVIPLFISAFERSEELANAMEARGYDPKAKRSRFKLLHFHFLDLISLLVVLIIFGGAISLFAYEKNVSQVNLIQWIFNINPGF